jgi:hypothetical protein
MILVMHNKYNIFLNIFFVKVETVPFDFSISENNTLCGRWSILVIS